MLFVLAFEAVVDLVREGSRRLELLLTCALHVLFTCSPRGWWLLALDSLSGWEPGKTPPHHISSSQVAVSTDVVKTDVAPMGCPGFAQTARALKTRVPEADGSARGLVGHPWPPGSATVHVQIHWEARDPESDTPLCSTGSEAGLCSAPVSPGTLSSIIPGAESGGVQGVPPVGSDWEDSWDTPPAPLLPPTPTI